MDHLSTTVWKIYHSLFASPDGLVPTTQHVIDKAKVIQVQTRDGLVPAKLLFQDEGTDMAVLKVEGDKNLSLAEARFEWES